MRTIVAVCAAVLALAGCATAPVAVSPPQVPWLDDAFGLRGTPVTVGKEELFRLPPELVQLASNPVLKRASPEERLATLTSAIFGPDRKGFGYVTGRTTTASETWARREGDCLSLTVLTYASARALGLTATMQEVQAPLTFDRQGRFDVLNEHVNLNVLFSHSLEGNILHAETIGAVIDFDPDSMRGVRGVPLTEEGILARYHNNIGVEHLTADRQQLAYAHLRAAIQGDPSYAAPYANLAVLYRARGFDREAEQLLLAALRLSPRPDLPLSALHTLMLQQGRDAEARGYAAQLEARQAYDPYYWTGRGLRHLQDGDARKAVDALLRARQLAPSFQEVRRYLALAYARNGDRNLAAVEQKALESMQDHTKLAGMPKKLMQ